MMTSNQSCPLPQRWKDLLEGALTAGEQTQLSGHLETCVACQRVLDRLAADSREWSEAAERLLHRQPPQEAALRHAMAQLKGGSAGAGTRTEPGPQDELTLDFLAPADKPGLFGRLDHYEIHEVIGRGGMGIVLRALDPSLNRFVAVKVMTPQLATSATARKRFAREAKAAAAVSHEHVVAIHAVAEANGMPYLVMEYVRGVSLQQRLERAGPLELAEILRIGVQTAAGLAAAHAQGLIHRDIKPANILLENGIERVKITDFGLARTLDDVSLTQSGTLTGTPQYMAPEQARGNPVDHRADLFSLGSVLYALCTGQAPFRGDSVMGVLRQVSEEAPPPIHESNPDIPDWLEDIVAVLHAKNPADRFQSAAEVAELLGQHLAHLQQPSVVPLPPKLQKPPTYQMVPRMVNARMFGYEYRSKRMLWGWPLIHIATGIDPTTGRKRIAKGILALGDVALGGIALGGVAIGGIAVGGMALGGIALGGMAVAVLLALGGGAIGAIALGGGALGLVAIGGGAVGYYALGGGAYGVHALGANAQDPEAIEFFRSWLGSWVEMYIRKRF